MLNMIQKKVYKKVCTCIYISSLNNNLSLDTLEKFTILARINLFKLPKESIMSPANLPSMKIIAGLMSPVNLPSMKIGAGPTQVKRRSCTKKIKIIICPCVKISLPIFSTKIIEEKSKLLTTKY